MARYTKDGEGKGVAIKQSSRGAVMQYDPDEFATGNEGLTSDNILIPRLTIIEGLSPQLQPRKTEFIPNCHIGQICDVVFKEVWDAIDIIPCVFKDIYIEWAPRNSGEGMVAYYGPDPTEYMKIRPDKKMRHIRENGNEIVKHGTVYCLNLSAGGRMSILPMSSTRYKSAQKFNSLRAEEQIIDQNGVSHLRKMCARIYHVSVGERVKGDNTWHIPEFTKGENTKEFDPSLNLWRRAIEFATQVESGMVMGDFGRDDEGEETGATSREDAPM